MWSSEASVRMLGSEGSVQAISFERKSLEGRHTYQKSQAEGTSHVGEWVVEG